MAIIVEGKVPQLHPLLIRVSCRAINVNRLDPIPTGSTNGMICYNDNIIEMSCHVPAKERYHFSCLTLLILYLPSPVGQAGIRSCVLGHGENRGSKLQKPTSLRKVWCGSGWQGKWLEGTCWAKQLMKSLPHPFINNTVYDWTSLSWAWSICFHGLLNDSGYPFWRVWDRRNTYQARDGNFGIHYSWKLGPRYG